MKNSSFAEWFDKSEQYFAFKFYANTCNNDIDEIIIRIFEDFYAYCISVGLDTSNLNVTDIKDFIKLQYKLFKINEKLKDINKDFE